MIGGAGVSGAPLGQAAPVSTEPDQLVDLFRRTATADPDRIAIRDADRSWSYAEVMAAASALARRLAELGVQPGDRVGVTAARRAGGPIAILAVLWSGAAYVPIDPGWPKARRDTVLRDAGIEVALLVDVDPEPTEQVRSVVTSTADLSRRAGGTDFEPRGRSAPGVAYVIFTSGSTGAPKGVEVRSVAAAGLVRSVAALVGMAADASLVALSSFAFDVSVFEIFAPWSVGGELIVATELQILSNQLAPLLRIPGRSVFLQSTPTVLARLIHTGLELPPDTVLLLAGEPLRRELVRQIGDIRQVWNLYGPTETTIYATAHPCLPLEPGVDEEDLPIGTAVNGAVLELRSPAAASGSAGIEVGELLIGGPGLAVGYLGRPDLTAERFLDGGLRYATGDLVRRRPDGVLVHAGRIDRQVKVRGNRVELDEVEVALAAVAGHGRVAVRLDDHAVIGPHLAAFIADPACDVVQLRRQLADRLPAYMVPTRIYPVAAIPTTSSGKTDHRALRVPGDDGA